VCLLSSPVRQMFHQMTLTLNDHAISSRIFFALSQVNFVGACLPQLKSPSGYSHFLDVLPNNDSHNRIFFPLMIVREKGISSEHLF
jgi:hypothetical protein